MIWFLKGHDENGLELTDIANLLKGVEGTFKSFENTFKGFQFVFYIYIFSNKRLLAVYSDY